MKNPPMKLNDHERNQLTHLFSPGSSPGPKSNESTRRVMSDNNGNIYDMGGDSHGVVVNVDSIPHIISEQHAKILDCGHTVTSLSQVLGRCDFGHILCHKHQFWMCAECRRIVCQFEVQEKDGMSVCPKCAGNGTAAIVLGIIAIIIAFIVAISVIP